MQSVRKGQPLAAPSSHSYGSNAILWDELKNGRSVMSHTEVQSIKKQYDLKINTTIFLQKISREDFMNNSVDAYISTRLRWEASVYYYNQSPQRRESV